MEMLLQKLTHIESSTKNKILTEQEKLEAIRSIQKMIKQIDLNSEVIQTDNAEKLTCLIKYFKGEDLTSAETDIVKSLTD